MLGSPLRSKLFPYTTLFRSSGVDLAKIKNVGWVDLLHPQDVIEAKKKFDMHFAARLPVTLIYRLRQKSGDYRWVQENGKPRDRKSTRLNSSHANNSYAVLCL